MTTIEIQAPPYEEPLTVVCSNGIALYEGDKLLHHWRDHPFLPEVLKVLGFEVDIIRAEWQDLPYSRGRHDAPPSLRSLKAHLEGVAAKKRSDEIAHLKDRLALLEAEERKAEMVMESRCVHD